MSPTREEVSTVSVRDSILRFIGNTPLIRLREVTRGLDAEVLVKAEYLNPSGSIKDRIALRMVQDAERAGRLRPGDTIVEASTGNTGAALAFVSAAKGYRLRVFAPSQVACPERIRIIESFGGRIEFLDVPSKSAGAEWLDGGVHGARVELLPRMACRDLERSEPGVWWARQFSNPCNVSAHRTGTGLEIMRQAGGPLHAFVASVGTGGTLLGVAQALLARDPVIQIYGVEPAADAPYLGMPLDQLEIIPGISDGIIVDIIKASLLAGVYRIPDSEAIDMARRLITQEGLFCGVSSGANVLAAMKVAERLGPGARVATVLPDSHDRYLTLEQYTT
jgi:cysteine synthase